MSEYKVNPHIRNKQSLDMDLVLVCQKRAIPFHTLSLHPEDVLQRAMQDLSLKILGNNNNKLFLHFMGELLKTASSVERNDAIDYTWFSESLTHFDEFLEKFGQNDNNAEYETHQVEQLRLFEPKSDVQ